MTQKKTWKHIIRPLRFVSDVAYVPLTRGYEAVIDASDAHLVAPWNWHAYISEDGYVYAARGCGRTLRLHTMLLRAHLVDHRDGNTLNNRRCNLRAATYTQNAQNRKRRIDCTSGFKGVGRHGSGWRARIVVDGRRHSLGTFPAPEEAAQAYDRFAVAHYGEFAVLNFPR